MPETSPPPASPDLTGLNDRALLRRFIQDTDERAFAEIIRRYHGLVMSVCRRVIGRGLDTEDAFQATFLILARRPRSIRKAESLSSWLYTVAWRTSVRLMRQRRKQPVDSPSLDPPDRSSDPLDQIASAQDLLVLDEELNQLPSKYRDVIVMTYFAQQSNQQVADQLDVSRGTVDGRLRRGRNIPRVRLARRGVSLGVIALAITLTTQATATASPALLTMTTQLGLQSLGRNGLLKTTDLSHLEPLVRPETVMISSQAAIAGAVVAAAVAGAFGLQGLLPGDIGNTASAQSTALTTEVRAEAINTGDPLVPAVTIGQTKELAADEQPSATDTSGMSASLSTAVPRYNRWPDDALPSEKWLYELLDEPIPLLDFQGDTPLSEILDYIANHYTSSHGGGDFRMTIFPDTAELNDAGILLKDVIVTDILLEGLSLENALELVFERASAEDIDDELTYVIRNEVMTITTAIKANELLETRSYPIGHLLAVDPTLAYPADSPRYDGSGIGGIDGGAGGGLFSVEDSEQEVVEIQSEMPPRIVTLVQKMTSPPALWDDSETGGTISLFGEHLIVRQSPPVHREIVRLLNVLSNAAK